MSKAKITVKLPSEVVDVITREAIKNGIGVQRLAGEVFMYGFNMIRAEQQEQAKKAKQDNIEGSHE